MERTGKEKEKKNDWIRDVALDMKRAINLYRHLAEDFFERKDFNELSNQAKNLSIMLGEKNIPPGALEKNSSSMKKFLLSLEKVEEGRLSRRNLERNYYASMFYSYKVHEELNYFLRYLDFII